MIGSIWNKWDLHIHSPLTNIETQYQQTTIDDFVDKLISTKISLIGVTNYFYFQQNELELIKESIRKKSADITVLGNIEFRLDQRNKDNEWINIHVIFNENIKTEAINDALSFLKIVNSDIYDRSVYCSQKSLHDANIPISDITVNYKELLKHLTEKFTSGKDYLIAVCPNGYGGFRPDMNDGRSVAQANIIERKGQIILGREIDRSFFLNNLTRYENAVSKPVFVCSDAHRLNGIGEHDNRKHGVGEKYTWVKAVPSFEGLRQVIIEPESRVQQTDNFIERLYAKPKFSRITLGGNLFENEELKFSDNTIYLNPNLVAIIGGRGTGKSLFLDAMKSSFKTDSLAINSRQVNTDSIKIYLDKGDQEEVCFNSLNNSYAYLHVSQGDIQHFSNKSNELSNEIKKMLRIHDIEIDSVQTNEISDNINKYRNFIQYWQELNSDNNRINTNQYQEGLIAKNNQLLATLTNPTNKELIDNYQNNEKYIFNLNQLNKELRTLEAKVIRDIDDINKDISQINTQYNLVSIVPLLGNDLTLNAIKNQVIANQSSINEKRQSNIQIKEQFKLQGINQDISSLLNKVSEYQQAITTATAKLEEIKHRTSQYQSYVANRIPYIHKVFLQLNSQIDKINNSFNELKSDKPYWTKEQNELVNKILRDIEIKGELVFDITSFYRGLERCINRGKFRATSGKTTQSRLENTFNVMNFESFKKLVLNEPIILTDNGLIGIEDLFWQDDYFNQNGRFELLSYLFTPNMINQYLKVNASFTYKTKSVEKLSVGQRGTFYVCLKLATDPFGSPFVFDQPEDDLDNDFIMRDLVPLFREIKKYRQVIIVTHNANLVVNTDAEQIIVAHNENEIISYTSGALENGNVSKGTGIRADICNILEGGQIAFEKRERKYGFHHLFNY